MSVPHHFIHLLIVGVLNVEHFLFERPNNCHIFFPFLGNLFGVSLLVLVSILLFDLSVLTLGHLLIPHDLLLQLSHVLPQLLQLLAVRL